MKAWFVFLFLGLGLGFQAVVADELAEAKAQFTEQDKALNGIYGELRKELSPELFAKLQEDQRNWIEYRDYIADWQAGQKQPDASVEKHETAAGLTESRVGWLKAWRKIGQRQGWSGRYSDSRGGLLEIVEKDGKHWFSLNVVRGPTYHLGEIGGKFRTNGRTGWFEVTGEGAEAPTWLTFLEENDGTGRIRVVGENTGYFHGARAYFDGSYLWLGPLTGEEQRMVIEGERE